MFALPKKLRINNKNYVADKQLGQGQEGVIFKGYDESDPKTPLAIKVCSHMKNDEFKFLQKHLLQKDHPNIIRYFDISVSTPEMPYFIVVMELGEGNLLDKVIQRWHNIELNEILQIFLQIARGIQSIHNHGFMHRDLKPENILLVKNQWKLCDFGLLRHKLSSVLTKQIGTPYYIAPEMVFQDENSSEKIEEYDQKIDVWALGCIVYEMYTTNLFFNGNNFEAVQSEIWKFASDNSHGIPEDGRFNRLPESLKKIVQKMLIVNSEQRITINEVIEEILKLLPNLQEKKNNEVFQTFKPPINIIATQKLQQSKSGAQLKINFPNQPQFHMPPQVANSYQFNPNVQQPPLFQPVQKFTQNPINFQNPNGESKIFI